MDHDDIEHLRRLLATARDEAHARLTRSVADRFERAGEVLDQLADGDR